MPAAEPLSVMPATVTALAVPMPALANVPVAPEVTIVTLAVSPASTPTSVPLPVSVAVVLPSYVLLEAVMPVTVIAKAVTLAVVVGCVRA